MKKTTTIAACFAVLAIGTLTSCPSQAEVWSCRKPGHSGTLYTNTPVASDDTDCLLDELERQPLMKVSPQAFEGLGRLSRPLEAGLLAREARLRDEAARVAKPQAKAAPIRKSSPKKKSKSESRKDGSDGPW